MLEKPIKNQEKKFLFYQSTRRKRTHVENFIKTPQKIIFFNRDSIFTIVNRSKINDQGFIYWIKESNKKINSRFLRQELYP